MGVKVPNCPVYAYRQTNVGKGFGLSTSPPFLESANVENGWFWVFTFPPFTEPANVEGCDVLGAHRPAVSGVGKFGCQDEEEGVKVDLVEIAELHRHNVMRALAREMVGALHESMEILRALATRTIEGENRVSFLKKEFFRSNPPEYSGEPDPIKVDKWLEQIVKSFEILDINDRELRVALVTYQLKGEADQWWKTVKHRVEHTWEAFVHAFQEKFLPLTAKERLRKQFEKLR
ncbi:unnamed protein product [Camellia sinensis]